MAVCTSGAYADAVRFALLLVLLSLTLPAVALADSHRAPRQLSSSSCTVVKVDGHAYVLYRQGVTCEWAKNWVRRLAASHGRAKPAGWSCTSGLRYRGNAWCERGGKHFGWDDGS
jgi:hypothetical protein